MNLKVGDKVRIKKDLKAGIYKTHIMVQDCMLEYAGKVATLEKEVRQGVFKIDLDGKTWSWYPFMFEEVLANKIPKLEAGMAVHCDTLDKSEIFLKECEKQGIKTMGGFPASKLSALCIWNRLRESTCYSISKRNNRKSLVIMHDNKGYYVDNPKYKLYEFDELFKAKLFKERLDDKMADSVETFMKAFEENIKQLNARFSVSIEKVSPITMPLRYEVLYEKQYYKDEKDVKKVIMNGRCVIVILENGDKGVAKCHPDDIFDKDIGFKVALKKARNCSDIGPAPF